MTVDRWENAKFWQTKAPNSGVTWSPGMTLNRQPFLMVVNICDNFHSKTANGFRDMTLDK